MGLLEGNKMSSSKGNVILLKDAIGDYTADVVRLFLMASAEPWQDCLKKIAFTRAIGSKDGCNRLGDFFGWSR